MANKSLSPRLLRAATRYALKPFLGPPWPIGFQRAWLRLLSRVNSPARDAELEWEDANGVRTRLARPTGQSPVGALLYLHGGAYCIGSPKTHEGLITHLATMAELVVHAPDYRLAPEHPYPAALRDTLAAYEWMLDQGVSPTKIALAGDSAGGGLALAAALAMRDEALPLPAALVLISPWVDLTCDSRSRRANAKIDPMIRTSWSKRCAELYVGDRSLQDPACSPLFADLRGLPPVLIQVGSDEVGLDDATSLDARGKAAGVDVTLEIYEGMWHVFQSSVGVMRESDHAVRRIADFLRGHVGAP